MLPGSVRGVELFQGCCFAAVGGCLFWFGGVSYGPAGC
ncbi:hypothetical protein A2U01_0071362 [Trifolium medium]|uniref:Uncharacterized protein n=1 Tax=Trifolium medium TaxID=97028 RepID=A0A392SMK0_9FABA|nr:hypothetical protein [Trifolium medium]